MNASNASPCDPLTASPAAGSGSDGLLATLAVAAVVAAPVFLSGCSGGGGGGDSGDNSPTLSITAIEIRVESDAGAAGTVTIDGRLQPATGGVRFALDGSPGQAADPGKSAATTTWSFLAHVAGDSNDRDHLISINPSPVSVAGGGMGATMVEKFQRARHVGARTGFGASWDDLLAFMGVDYDVAIDHLVDHLRTTPVQAPPDWIGTPILSWAQFSSLSRQEQEAYNDRKYPRRFALKQWWLREITLTPSPLSERLVAFWGNHFVVNIDDIEEPQIAWSWLSLLRQHASGNLRAFVHAMALHPAMLLFLDNASNRKVRATGVTSGPLDRPSNENFARELMELFTLGEGVLYDEDDVIAVARAFTGHNVDDYKAYEFFNSTTVPGKDRHDRLDLTILAVGPRPFTGPEAIDVIMEAKMDPADEVPRTATFIVEKLWDEFVGTSRTPADVLALAKLLCPPGSVNPTDPTAASGRWNLAPLYRALFKHPQFRDGGTNQAAKQLKMPMELIAGFFRSLGLTPKDGKWDSPVWVCGDEDQDPLAPPNVKGWLGGVSWINAKTLLSRFEHMQWYGWDYGGKIPAAIREGFKDLMLAVPLYDPAKVDAVAASDFAKKIRELIKDPAYQMK